MIQNYNIATINNFKLEIPGYSEVNYFVQEFSFPPVTMESIDEVFYQNYQIPIPTDTIFFGKFTATIILDENLRVYQTIFNWLKTNRTQVLLKDIDLLFLNANKNVYNKLKFYNSFPIEIDGFALDTSIFDVNPIFINATFAYTDFDFGQ